MGIRQRTKQIKSLSSMCLYCHNDTVIEFVTVSSVQPAGVCPGLSVRRVCHEALRFWDPWRFLWNGQNTLLLCCFPFTYGVFWEEKHNCQIIQFLSPRGKCSNCKASAQLVQNEGVTPYIGGGERWWLQGFEKSITNKD